MRLNAKTIGVRMALLCCGLGLVTAAKTVLSDVADSVLTVGVEVQNTVKAVYGADILAGAGHYASQRKGNNFGDMYTYSETTDLLDSLHTEYPNITTAKTSLGQTHEGRDVWAIKLSDNPNVQEDEPVTRVEPAPHLLKRNLGNILNFFQFLVFFTILYFKSSHKSHQQYGSIFSTNLPIYILLLFYLIMEYQILGQP